MKKPEQILADFKLLSPTAQEQILQSLRIEFEGKGKLLDIVKAELKGQFIKKPCPHCTSSNVQKRGIQSGNQMYKCVACKKWFSSTTGTPLWDIKLKNKWQSYLNCMQQNMTIREIAKEIGICIQTSFDWRHKILSVLNEHTPKMLSGRVECDELELSFSNKGERNLTRKPRKRASDFKRNNNTEDITTVQVVTAIDETNAKYLKVIETKRVTSKQLSKTIGKKLDKNVTLITDMHPSYKPLVKAKPKVKHKTVKASEHVNRKDKKINLQKVNNAHMQLRQFLKPFNGGVSTKYLQNYLNWFAYGEKMKWSENQLKQWFYEILNSSVAYNHYQSTKKNAVNFRT